ncbi:MAG: glycosyltransferase involved in cell wall biosynthesis [Planctomycetota bacterium]|jgi:glycosyltransferase involved in cell wall biosynthesis
MRLLMVSGDRQVAIGERGPFYSMQAEFSRYFERIDVLTPRPDRPITVNTIHDNVHFHPADCSRRKMAASIRRKGQELIEAHGHSLIVSHDYGWFYNGLGSAALSRATKVPYLSEIHHVPGVPVAADLREVVDRRIARAYVRWARKRALGFRVVNGTEMPTLLQSWGVPSEQVHVMHSLYIDLETFQPSPDPNPTIDQDVVFVGRMVNNKGLHRIVDALAILAEKGRPATALFLGRGPMRKSTEARVAKRGISKYVRFLDWVETPDDLADVYRASRICVCASTCEGGPRVTVEAMACGVPSVSTPVGIMAEILNDGENGERADFDAPSLARAFDRALSDEDRRIKMGVAARQTVQRFEYSRIIGEYAQGLGRLVGEELVRA